MPFVPTPQRQAATEDAFECSKHSALADIYAGDKRETEPMATASALQKSIKADPGRQPGLQRKISAKQVVPQEQHIPGTQIAYIPKTPRGPRKTNRCGMTS